MNNFALVLVFVSAFLHATWNLLAKRTEGGAPLVWLYDVISAILYAPLVVAIVILQHIDLSPVQIGFILGSGLIHLGYFLFLQRGYRVGDLSLIYPLARGTGPLLSTTAAIVFLGERPTLIAITGVVLIVTGVFLIAGGPRIFTRAGASRAVTYGILVGVLIATYTLWDKQAVSTFLIQPILFFYGSILVDTILLTPYALRHWSSVRTEWRAHRLEVGGIALLSPASYFLVLSALTFAPVSYVAPLRESSVLIGTIMGTRLLAEGNAKQRILAVCVMVLGIVALAV